MPLQLLLPSSYYLYLSKKTSCYLTPWTTQQTLRTAKEQEIECNAVAWESIKQLLTFPSESTSRSLGGHGGLGEAWPTPSAAIYSVGPRRPPACLSCVCVSWEKLGSKQGRKAYVSPKGRGSWELKPSKEKGSLLLCWARREREREKGACSVQRQQGQKERREQMSNGCQLFFLLFSRVRTALAAHSHCHRNACPHTHPHTSLQFISHLHFLFFPQLPSLTASGPRHMLGLRTTCQSPRVFC